MLYQRSYIPLVACLAIFLQYAHPVVSFAAQIYTIQQRISQRSYVCPTIHLGAYLSPKSSPLEDEPWKKDDSYWDMLQEASKDPVAFEKFIEESRTRKKLGKSLNGTKAVELSEGEVKPERKGKYVPIEEWDAKQKDDMSAEEKLQWECQRGGNQIRQNDILMHHLKSF